MPVLAEPAEETRLPGSLTDGLPGLASFRAEHPGYDDTTAPDALRASEYWYLDAEGQTYLDYTGAGLPARLAAPRAGARRGLFAFPAQSNFSGVRHQLSLVDLAHEHGYDVLLDAAAYVPSHRLDLSVVYPDFVPVSWYKMFGYPTGVGSPIVRRDALARLRRPWFAGGTISAVSVQGDWHAAADGEAGFEDGTPSFLNIPDVEFGAENPPRSRLPRHCGGPSGRARQARKQPRWCDLHGERVLGP
jgi:hypothetical protein